jgi:hypothetical protein
MRRHLRVKLQLYILSYDVKENPGMCPLISFHQNLNGFLGEKKFCT